jgi:hypothetical protein
MIPSERSSRRDSPDAMRCGHNVGISRVVAKVWTFTSVKRPGFPVLSVVSLVAYSGSSEPVGNGRTGSRGWSCWQIEEECGSFDT